MDWRMLVSLFSLPEKLIEKVMEAVLSLAQSELARVRGVEADMEKLREKAAWIHALLSDAEERRIIEDETVKRWLRNLKDLALDYDDLKDEVETLPNRKRKRARSLLDTVNSILFKRRRIIASEIEEIKGRYEDIKKRRENLRLETGDARRRVQTSPSPQAGSLQDESRVLSGFSQKAEIVQVLVSNDMDHVPIIPIFASGGMGKTTLARLIFNDQDVQRYFHQRIWVGVSQGFDIVRTTREIVEAITRNKCDDLSLDILQHQLHFWLSGKRFLLVLDNVSNEDLRFWESLRDSLIVGKGGSKVLITTQHDPRKMCTNMDRVFSLKGLGEEDCWVLFRDWALPGGAWNEHQNLQKIGEEIVKRCQGSPLAAKLLGRLLSSVRDEEDWKSVLSELGEFEASKNDILPTLKVSYDHLPLHLKLCFAYCSIFPNDYQFDKDELVKFWIAQGFIQHQHRRLEAVGGSYFDDLLWMSFFQISESYQKHKPTYKMPSLIRELAQSVSKHECLRLEHDVPHAESESARHASLFHHNNEHIAFEKSHKYKRLRTLKLCGVGRAPLKQVPRDLFSKLRYLRTLDLSNSELIELPDSVDELIHLRYLGLSDTQIKKLPESVSNLYNLQTLELGECYKLLELPKGMSNLINLRHLGLHLDWDRETDLDSIPPAIGWDRGTDFFSMSPGIGRLTSLQTLSRFTVGPESGCGIEELKNLNKLRGELHISKLENVNARNADEAILTDKQYIDTITLRWSTDTPISAQHGGGGAEEVIESLRPYTNLKYLWIENYNGVNLPNWLGDTSFTKLETLRLSYCRRCECLQLLGQLPQLKDLRIEGLRRVKNLSALMGFPSLEVLTLWDMPDLERWFEVGANIPHLMELFLSHCPKLDELSYLPPMLTKLRLRNCQGLIKLPSLPSISDLVVESGNQLMILEGINHLTSLSSLTILNFSSLQHLPKRSLQCLTSLKKLKIGGCNELISLAGNEGLKDLTSLEWLEISSCPKLESFSEGGLPTTLRISNT